MKNLAIVNPTTMTDCELQDELTNLRSQRKSLLQYIDGLETEIIALKEEERKRIEIKREEELCRQALEHNLSVDESL